MYKSTKPTGGKNYGSIPHLLSSRRGKGDHGCNDGQSRIATQKARDKHDRVIVQEKLDGSNVGVAKVDDRIVAIGRSGYPAVSSPHIQHCYFNEWVVSNRDRFDRLLQEGERVCGEWLMQAHGTKYDLTHEPFVPFDIMQGKTRCNYDTFKRRVWDYDFTIPKVLHDGAPINECEAISLLGLFGHHGATEPAEGVVWRVERKGVVDFLVKYVRHTKVDGLHFPENTGGDIVWNITPEELRGSLK